MTNVQRFYVYPEQFSADRPTVHALSRLRADIDAVLAANIPADVKQQLFHHALNRYLAVRRSDEGRRAAVDVEPASTSSSQAVQTMPVPAAVHEVQTEPVQAVQTEPVQVAQTEQAAPTTPAAHTEQAAHTSPGSPEYEDAPAAPIEQSPPLARGSKNTAKNYAVAVLEAELQKFLDWDTQGRIRVDNKKYNQTNIQEIVEYLAESNPNREAPAGINLVLQKMAINKVRPEVVRNKRVFKQFQQSFISKASPRRARSKWEEQ